MSLSIPTTSALPSAQTIPATHPSVLKILHRLSRPSLLSLVLDWLDDRNKENAPPYLFREDEVEPNDDLYPPASSLPQLREIYADLQARKGSKRDVVDRIIEGDWRDGITLYQLAMADMQYLYDHPASQKWTALKVVPLQSTEKPDEKQTTAIPRFHPATFLQNLQRELLPDVKAHYNLDRHPNLPLLILRIYINDTPYNTSLALQSHDTISKAMNPKIAVKTSTFDASKTFYIAFPFASPYIYVSLATATATTIPKQGSISDTKSLRKLTLEGIPKAFSRRRERYRLESTGLSARNLEALCERRGGARTNAVSGGWGVYADAKGQMGENPLDLNAQLPSPDPTDEDEQDGGRGKKGPGMKRKKVDEGGIGKRRKLVANGRFGNSAKSNDGKGVERLDVRLEDLFPSVTLSKPLFGEVVPESEPVPAAGKKRKGRRSTISLQLDQAEDEEEGGEWRPDIRVTFQGQHVFAGVRELVELGVIDGEKMPGWMTGEEGISVGVVRDGRIKGWKGSGV